MTIPSPSAWLADPVAAWLLAPGTRRLDAAVVVDGLARRLAASGLPVWRMSMGVPTKHPFLFRRNIQWSEERGAVDHYRPHEMLDTPMFLDSPIAVLYSGRERSLRKRLVGPDADVRYP